MITEYRAVHQDAREPGGAPLGALGGVLRQRCQDYNYLTLAAALAKLLNTLHENC